VSFINRTARKVLPGNRWCKCQDKGGQAWWFIPAILATWEVEIKRIVAQGQFGQKVHKTPYQPIKVGCGSIYLSSQLRRKDK
jgi:hypothetical protein